MLEPPSLNLLPESLLLEFLTLNLTGDISFYSLPLRSNVTKAIWGLQSPALHTSSLGAFVL